MAEPTMADFLQGRDQALADLAWEQSPGNWLLRQGKGFASGAVSPLWMVAEPRGEYGQAFRDTMSRWEDEAPYANTFGTLSTLGRGFANAVGMPAKDLGHLLGVLSPATPLVRNVQDAVTGDNKRREELQRAREYGAAGY